MKDILKELSGKGTAGLNGELYLHIPEEKFEESINKMAEENFCLIALFAAQNMGAEFTLFYSFERPDIKEIIIITRELKANKTTSIAKTFPSASWFERETTDMFGIEFEGSFDKRRLVLHDIYPKGFHPLLKSFKNETIKTIKNPSDEYVFNEIKGEGVYQIPVGPVHAGIIEPGHFRFSVIGETIFNLEVRMFYKHRGIEKLAEGKNLKEAVKIAETISGDESAANAFAYSAAVEKIAKTSVPQRAEQLRALLLEMERIYSHLGDIAGMVVDVAYPVGASEMFVLREEILRRNEKLTGSRFLKGIITPGGLTKDIPASELSSLSKFLGGFAKTFNKLTEDLLSRPSIYDRFETTGVVKKELIAPLNLSGPIARAAGIRKDTRLDHPYGYYPKLKMETRTGETGDVLARFKLKSKEINDSIGIIQKICLSASKGEVHAKTDEKAHDGFVTIIIEAPRGQTLHFLHIKNGTISRFKFRTASFCNWQSIQHAVIGNIVPDFPLINKSMNLSYAGTDM